MIENTTVKQTHLSRKQIISINKGIVKQNDEELSHQKKGEKWSRFGGSPKFIRFLLHVVGTLDMALIFSNDILWILNFTGPIQKNSLNNK